MNRVSSRHATPMQASLWPARGQHGSPPAARLQGACRLWQGLESQRIGQQAGLRRWAAWPYSKPLGFEAAGCLAPIAASWATESGHGRNIR